MLIWEVDRVCRRYPAAGTPTTYLGLNAYFSDAVCAVIDMGIAAYGEWVDGRRESRQKAGRYKTKPMFTTLEGLLGIAEARERAGKSSAEFTEAVKAYKYLAIEAIARGEDPPLPPSREDFLEGNIGAEDAYSIWLDDPPEDEPEPEHLFTEEE